MGPRSSDSNAWLGVRGRGSVRVRVRVMVRVRVRSRVRVRVKHPLGSRSPVPGDENAPSALTYFFTVSRSWRYSRSSMMSSAPG